MCDAMCQTVELMMQSSLATLDAAVQTIEIAVEARTDGQDSSVVNRESAEVGGFVKDEKMDDEDELKDERMNLDNSGIGNSALMHTDDNSLEKEGSAGNVTQQQTEESACQQKNLCPEERVKEEQQETLSAKIEMEEENKVSNAKVEIVSKLKPKKASGKMTKKSKAGKKFFETFSSTTSSNKY